MRLGVTRSLDGIVIVCFTSDDAALTGQVLVHPQESKATIVTVLMVNGQFYPPIEVSVHDGESGEWPIYTKEEREIGGKDVWSGRDSI